MAIAVFKANEVRGEQLDWIILRDGGLSLLATRNTHGRGEPAQIEWVQHYPYATVTLMEFVQHGSACGSCKSARYKQNPLGEHDAALYKHLTVLPILAAYLTFAAPAATQPPSSEQVQQSASGSAGTSDFPAWDNFTNQLREIGHQMIAKLPDRLRDDPQVRQEAGRLLLEALAARTIAAISADGDHPTFLPAMNITLKAGTPNADTTYRSAIITAGGEYRLRGEIGSLRVFMLGQSGRMPAGANAQMQGPIFLDFKALHLDKGGRFDVILSPSRPQGYTGDWWQLAPTTTGLLVRQVAFDWATERVRSNGWTSR